MPSLLLINQYFWPDVAATAQLLADLAENAAARGWRVTAMASRGAYAVPGQPALASREAWQGVDVVRVRCTSLGRASIWRRMADYLSFMGNVGARVAFGRRHDVVICLSTPPMVAVLGLLAKMRGSRFVYKVEDLYPDVAIALGTLKPRTLLARILSWTSALVLRRADVCVALDRAMGRTLRDRGAREVEVIPNWADEGAIRPQPRAGRDFRAAQGIDDDKVLVLYSGNLGWAHTFDAVVEAAGRLAVEAPELLFLFVGAGARLDEVVRGTAGLANVRFLPYQPRESLGRLYNAADVHLVTLRDEVAGLLAPSKYPAALAAGKSVLLIGGRGSEMHEEIVKETVGAAVTTSGEVASFLLSATRDRARLEQTGRRARRLFEAKYERSRAVGRWLDVLSDLAGPATG